MIYRIIMINLSCLLMFHCFNTVEIVYGEDKVTEYSRHAVPYFLLVKDSAGDSDYIKEDDIIITIDEPDKEAGKETSEKAITKNKKEEKKKSSSSHKLVSEYLKKGKKFEARNEL